MSHSIEIYLTTAFWLGVLVVVIRVVFLVSDHPRQQKPVNIGTDVSALLFSLAMLAWVSVLRFAA